MKPEEIRQIRIPVVRISSDPDSHIEYAVQVQGPVRSWTVWHRYRDFDALHTVLLARFPNDPPPALLPPKALNAWLDKLNPFSWGAGSRTDSLKSYGEKQSAMSIKDLKKTHAMEPLAATKLGESVEARRQGLEQYLRAIHSHEKGRWRSTDIWREFLAPSGNLLVNWSAPNGQSGDGDLNEFSGLAGQNGQDKVLVTVQSWLEDYRGADQLTRDIRELIWRRESALSRNEVSTSHQCTLQARRQLASLESAIADLEAGLRVLTGKGPTVRSTFGSGASQTISVPALSKGEALRRQDKLRALKEEHAKLNKLALGESGDRISAAASSGLHRMNDYAEVTASNANKKALLQNDHPGLGVSSGRRTFNGGSHAGLSTATSPSRVIASASFGSSASSSSNGRAGSSTPRSHMSNGTHGGGGWRSKRVFGNSAAHIPQETD
ncbi:hypothetical protein EV182_003629, partial [Spiromyces aspiralis]